MTIDSVMRIEKKNYPQRKIKSRFAETFLWCGDFSTMWRLSEQSTVCRLSVQRASYRIRTCFAVGKYVRRLVFYPFGHRAIQSVID